MPPTNRPEQQQQQAASSNSQAGGAGAARKEDNIYIPSFISKQPFYVTGLDDQDDSLRHQRSRVADDSDKTSLAKRGKAGPARTKWVKGACENCGAMGHKKKDCLERPRKVGAKWSGKDIQADRVIQEVKLGYEAKRDVYQTYDPKQYQEVVAEYNLVEEARRQLMQDKNGNVAENGTADGGSPQKDDEPGENGTDTPKNEYEAGFKYAEESEMGRDRSIKQSMRLREDTAKYLLNLDPDSAKYNPKKRTLVDPGAIADKSAALFAEESFLRASGQAAEFERAQRYAWEAQEKSGNTDLHLEANPTAGAILRKKETEEREAKRRKRAELLASQYGEQPVVPDALKGVTITENEAFVEYDEAGLIKGAPRKAAKSKYAEDVLTNNHTSVWGSWWSDFKWGYACCHSVLKNSYCTGETGKSASKESEAWDKQ
ncbi:Pre-mRNA splicing Prp18-interacting factor-domain-containing protein [Cercophora newfieldiana]|uniref:Pre-mRNA-splicing factor SLU7 n=1 Tax=Cercophora newfieldiana TaxID=92897 RepID=A0AA39YMH0_9PEZI|nr:Pre-mRNA splicing Prp18-interacting factor-domain-containing protein [Cercophora newfieldiana]